VENAKKTGTVLADLLRVGDRVLVTDFSAKDNPPGCGLPSGSGNCQMDIITRLARTDVVAPVAERHRRNQGGDQQSHAARSGLLSVKACGTPRTSWWRRLAIPIPITSSCSAMGDENVNPLYAAVKDELKNSGVIIDTIRFSNDAPGALLAQIASDTGAAIPTCPPRRARWQRWSSPARDWSTSSPRWAYPLTDQPVGGGLAAWTAGAGQRL